MTSTIQPTTSLEFFEKYGLSSPEDKLSQNVDEKLLQELVQDFENLSHKDQYAIFIRLRQGEEMEALRLITGLGFDAQWMQSKNPFDVKSRLKALKKALIKDTKDKSDGIWKKRLEVERVRFGFEEMIQGARELFVTGDNEINFSEIVTMQNSIYEGLKEIYNEKKFYHISRAVFDSDHDFDPYNPSSHAFDHKDVLPLDPIGYEDKDYDGMVDSLDIDPSDSSSWTHLGIGETEQVSDVLSITRIAEKEFDFNIHITIDVDPNVGEHERPDVREKMILVIKY